MNPAKVDRHRLHRLTDLPNIGPAMAGDLQRLGITRPQQLAGQDAWQLYQRLCRASGVRQDPCVLDTFIAITRFMDGDEPRPWWAYTAERKRRYGRV
jgi:Pathogenicity locus